MFPVLATVRRLSQHVIASFFSLSPYRGSRLNRLDPFCLLFTIVVTFSISDCIQWFSPLVADDAKFAYGIEYFSSSLCHSFILFSLRRKETAGRRESAPPFSFHPNLHLHDTTLGLAYEGQERSYIDKQVQRGFRVGV